MRRVGVRERESVLQDVESRKNAVSHASQSEYVRYCFPRLSSGPVCCHQRQMALGKCLTRLAIVGLRGQWVCMFCGAHHVVLVQ